jgi:sulfotransferase family protein
MLLSAGGFALYLGESNIFNLLAPRFGDLAIRKNRERMWQVWQRSSLFRVSGLNRSDVESRILDACRNAGDFLRIVMEEVARQQGARRWAGNAPEEILHLRQIKKTIPEALVIHMIRDGRDVSISLSQKRYIRPFPWKDRETPKGAALYWEWIVRKGRAVGAELGNDYIEVHFEELLRDPRSVLRRLSAFLEHDLDYDRIQENRVGAVAKPNSSFRPSSEGNFNPVARWKQQLTTDQLTRIEGLVGSTLSELGYELATSGWDACNPLYRAWNHLLYRQFFELKLRSKKNSVLRRLRKPLTSKHVDEVVLVDEEAARMRAAPATGADCDLAGERSTVGRMAGQP